MNEVTCPVETGEALQELGFMQDEKVYSEQVMGLSYDFGRFQITAGRIMNLSMREVWNFSGVVGNSNFISCMNFEMPLQVESVEQCAAWVVWHLKQHIPSRAKIFPRTLSYLLLLGLEHQATLPWVRDLAAYKAAYEVRPKCMVKRDWLRLALKELKTALVEVNDTDDVQFHFDGSVLYMYCPNERIVCPASGDAWQKQYVIAARNLRNLPKSLMQETLCIDIWESKLGIARHCYPDIRELVQQQTLRATINE
ncbi:hypothetical protein [Aeromonas media]|uniref:hypothetical protein n=1 Tax=Aeromonas media TaxID=651 RepID=UPI003D23F88C